MAIVKANKLIETSYKLGSREQFFILYLIAQISQEDTDFETYQMHYSDVAQILNFDGRRRIANKSDVFKLMNNLNNNPIRFTDGDEDVQSVWITELRSNRKTGVLTFTFPTSLKNYLLQLRQHFTQYNIHNIVYLNGHSTRMYEILKRYEFRKEVILTVEKLKFFLGIPNKYAEFYEFKRRILKPAQEELLKYTDLKFTYKPVDKVGKKVISLLFVISKNVPEEQPEALKLLEDFTPKRNKTKTDSTTFTQRPKKYTHLTFAQQRAFHFLEAKSINKNFIVTKILEHPKLKYEVVRGYEDVYIKYVWTFFKEKTRSKNLAGTFVNWWKGEKLTDENLHAKHCELLVTHKKNMKSEELDNRNLAKIMFADDFLKLMEEAKGQLKDDVLAKTIQPKSSNKAIPLSDLMTNKETQVDVKKYFNFEIFKHHHGKQFNIFMDKVIIDYKTTIESTGQTFDFNKYSKAIEQRVKVLCEEWWKQDNV
ncbi:MAG: replication initiation protein [Saprospiraceae bacterium]